MIAGLGWTRRNPAFAAGVDPFVDLFRVEPDELADLEERHAVFGGESTNESLGDAESFGEVRHIDEFS